MVLFARKRGIPVLSLIDVIARSVTIGLFLGRLANFINGELWGRADRRALGHGRSRPAAPLPRHPSQLYEATLEGLVLFVVLGLLMRARRAAPARPVIGALRDRLRVARIVLRVLPRAGHAARLPLGLAHHGHGAVAAAAAGRHRADRDRAAPAAAERRRSCAMTPLEAEIRARHRGRRSDHGRRLHGALPRPSAARLLRDARSVRRGRRFRHRAGDQPDVRRADRRCGPRRPGGRWARRRRARWSSSAPAAAR